MPIIEFQKSQAKHGTVCQIDRLMDQFHCGPARSLLAFPFRCSRQVHDGNGNRTDRRHRIRRAAFDRGKTSAQYLVTTDDRIQTSFQSRYIERPRDLDRQRDVVGGMVGLELMRERVVRETERRLAGDLLAEALGGRLDPDELRGRLRPFGIESEAAVLLFELEDAHAGEQALELELGVSAAAAMPMAMPGGVAAGGGGAAAPAEEKTEFNVTLTEIGADKIKVIKVVREVTNLGLKEAKDLVESAPKPIKEGVNKEEADGIKKKFEEVGAKVSIS